MKTYKPSLIIPEREILKSGIALLCALGWDCHRRNVVACHIRDHFSKSRFFRANEPGMSDVWGTIPDGRHFELEFKRHGQIPTELQLDWLLRMNARPSTVAFWVDDTAILERIARHLMAGGSVEYTGQWADYDLVKGKP